MTYAQKIMLARVDAGENNFTEEEEAVLNGIGLREEAISRGFESEAEYAQHLERKYERRMDTA